MGRAWRGLLIGVMTLFVVNIGLMIASVATSSFARRWLGTWLPEGWTTSWYTPRGRSSSSATCCG
jgi:putative spermidine/putrescine transport system permease protein